VYHQNYEECVCLCWWVNDSLHRTAKLCITIFIQIRKFLTTSIFKMYVKFEFYHIIIKRDKSKTSVNYSTKGLFCVGGGWDSFCKSHHILKENKNTESHVSSYCSDNDFLLFTRTRQDSFLKIYFAVWPLVKLGLFILWIIFVFAIPPTCQNCRKETHETPGSQAISGRDRPPQTRVRGHPWASLWIMDGVWTGNTFASYSCTIKTNCN
jgi:hypothetical protein